MIFQSYIIFKINNSPTDKICRYSVNCENPSTKNNNEFIITFLIYIKFVLHDMWQNCTFSSSVWGILNSRKRLKPFNYLKNSIKWDDFIFLQEMHSSTKNDKTWIDNFKSNLLFSRGKTSSRRVAIGYLGTKKINNKPQNNWY